jgi:hypothetical protein
LRLPRQDRIGAVGTHFYLAAAFVLLVGPSELPIAETLARP